MCPGLDLTGSSKIKILQIHSDGQFRRVVQATRFCIYPAEMCANGAAYPVRRPEDPCNAANRLAVLLLTASCGISSLAWVTI